MHDKCAMILDRIMSNSKDDNNSLFNMDIWDWSQGVALYGVWKHYLLTGDRRGLDYLTAWVDGKLYTVEERNVNTMAPLITLCFLHEATGKKAYLDFCLEWGEWVLEKMPPTEMGGIQHLTIDARNEQQLWADTVFMTVLFLAKLGGMSGQRRFMDEAKKQLILHIRFLACKRTGLWYHGWSFLRRDNFAGAFWARGNCWFTIAAVELEEMMPLEAWERALILDAYRAQATSLRALQDASGLWHTLVDHPDTYLETSGSAGFAYGMLKSVRLGILDESFRETAVRAARAVVRQVDGRGMVNGVSYGTVVSDDLTYYKRIPIRPTGYGQNLTLMLLTEMLEWERRFPGANIMG